MVASIILEARECAVVTKKHSNVRHSGGLVQLGRSFFDTTVVNNESSTANTCVMLWLWCHDAQVGAYFKDFWNLLDLFTLFMQFVSVLLWLECYTSLATAAFSPRLEYDVYDIKPDCPGANLARFNETELTELRLM